MRDHFTITTCLLLLASFGAAAPVSAQTWQPEDEASWTRLVEAGDFAELIETADTLAHWPATRSADAAVDAGHQTADAETRRRGLAERSLYQLDAFRQTLRARPAATLDESLEGLLALRRAVGSAPGYVNLLMADAINRTLVTEIAFRLVDGGTAFRPSAELSATLRTYRIDVRDLVAIAETEVGEHLTFVIPPEGETPVRTLARLIETVTGNIEMALAPLADLESTGVFALLERPDFGKLLSRLWLTDQRLHVALPMLVVYAGAVPQRPLAADIESIGRAFDLDNLESGPFGSPISRATPMAVYDVAGLIRAVRNGRLKLFAAFNPT